VTYGFDARSAGVSPLQVKVSARRPDDGSTELRDALGIDARVRMEKVGATNLSTNVRVHPAHEVTATVLQPG
jgi:hypothetical protein